MTFKRLLISALLALVLPTAASAQTPVPPPQGDNYLQPLFLNDTQNVFPYNDPIGFTGDTTTYTTQADMFNPPGNGGPAEPNQCGSSAYGNTIWSVFYAHRWGILRIDTAGAFDSVIGFVPFRSPDDPRPLLQFGTCIDALSGLQESDAEVVFPGQWFAVQVGGTGAKLGGTMQAKFELSKPPQVDGQAFLFWDRGGRRVTKMYARRLTKGATLTLSCTKRACRKRTVKVKSKAALTKLFTSSGLVPVSSSARMKGAPAGARGGTLQATRLARQAVSDPKAHAAAKTIRLLTNKAVKSGARIELRVKAFGYIGKYFRWNVQRNGISAATIRCMNPESNKPRKRCSG